MSQSTALDDAAIYPRDLVGYGKDLPVIRWKGDARLAVIIAVNYEVGAELSILHGDDASEAALSDTPFPSYIGERSLLVESSYEYGSRRGIWRILEMLTARNVRASLFGVGMALERNPEVCAEYYAAGHEIVAHGYRWVDYRNMPEDLEREYMQRAIEVIRGITGQRPMGWMTGRPGPNTRRLVVENGFGYDRDSLNDDLPYWTRVGERAHLVIPYSYELNDMRYGSSQGGFVTGEHFKRCLVEAFDQLYEEGAMAPRIMSIGLHDRTVGRPGRARAFGEFLDHALAHEGVWFTTAADVADIWREQFPADEGRHG